MAKLEMEEDQPIGSRDESKGTSPVVTEVAEPRDVYCYWDGYAYSVGSVICKAGYIHQCWSDGTWYRKGSC